MFCNNCGAEIGSQAKFCQKCGSSVVGTSSIETNALSGEMTFGKSISVCFSKYADFNGRASRPEFWWFYLFTVLLSWGSVLVDQTGVLSMIVNLAFALPTLAAGSRRLHDVGRSGWWQLLTITVIGLIPLIIWYASKGEPSSNKFGEVI